MFEISKLVLVRNRNTAFAYVFKGNPTNSLISDISLRNYKNKINQILIRNDKI